MTGTKKPNLVRPQSPGWTGLYKVAIAGAASLKGKEVKEVLDERNFPANEILLLDDDESLGQLETVGEEATFIQNTKHSRASIGRPPKMRAAPSWTSRMPWRLSRTSAYVHRGWRRNWNRRSNGRQSWIWKPQLLPLRILQP